MTKNYLDQLADADFMHLPTFDHRGERQYGVADLYGVLEKEGSHTFEVQINNNPPISIPPMATVIFHEVKELRANFLSWSEKPLNNVQPMPCGEMTDLDKTLTSFALKAIEQQTQSIKERDGALVVSAIFDSHATGKRENIQLEDGVGFLSDMQAALAQMHHHELESDKPLTPLQEIMRDSGVSSIGDMLSIPCSPTHQNLSSSKSIDSNAYVFARESLSKQDRLFCPMDSFSIKDLGDASDNHTLVAIAAARVAPTVSDITNTEARAALLVIFERERDKVRSGLADRKAYLEHAIHPVEQAINNRVDAPDFDARELTMDNDTLATAFTALEAYSLDAFVDAVEEGYLVSAQMDFDEQNAQRNALVRHPFTPVFR